MFANFDSALTIGGFVVLAAARGFGHAPINSPLDLSEVDRERLVFGLASDELLCIFPALLL
jgi:hypothetical protein